MKIKKDMRGFDINKLVRKNIRELFHTLQPGMNFKTNGEAIFLDANENPFNNGFKQVSGSMSVGIEEENFNS